MRWLLPLCFVGCATAGPPDQLGGFTDGGTRRADSSIQPSNVDAFVSHIDAPPGQQIKTLDENTSDTFAAGKSVACPSTDGEGDTAANSYYRVFDLSLAQFGVSTAFHVTQVSFQVEDSEGTDADGGTSVAVSVGQYTGTIGTTLSLGGLTVLDSNSNVDVPEVIEGMAGITVNVPLNATIPAQGKVFIEVDSADGSFDHSFYVGANTAGESGDSYMLALGCDVNTPSAVTTFYTTHKVDLLMTVTGTY